MFMAAKAGDGQAARQAARLDSLLLLSTQRLERMAVITIVFQHLKDLRGLHCTISPGDVQPPIGEIEPRLGYPRHALHCSFNARNAGAASNAVNRKIHTDNAVACRLCIK